MPRYIGIKGVWEIIAGSSSRAVEKNIKELLHLFWHDEDYLIRCRAHFLLLGLARQLPDNEQLSQGILQNIFSESDEEFRLRALEILSCMAGKQSVGRLKGLLADRDPLIVRGTIVALGEIGGAFACEVIADFAVSAAGRLLRREIVGQALGSALVKTEAVELEEIMAKGADYRRYFADLKLWGPGEKKRFDIYPASDYFKLQCDYRGIDFFLYKKLVFKGEGINSEGALL